MGHSYLRFSYEETLNKNDLVLDSAVPQFNLLLVITFVVGDSFLLSGFDPNKGFLKEVAKLQKHDLSLTAVNYGRDSKISSGATIRSLPLDDMLLAIEVTRGVAQTIIVGRSKRQLFCKRLDATINAASNIMQFQIPFHLLLQCKFQLRLINGKCANSSGSGDWPH